MFETIKLAFIYFFAILAALIVGAWLGHPEYGIVFLIAYAGFKNGRERIKRRKDKEIEKE